MFRHTRSIAPLLFLLAAACATPDRAIVDAHVSVTAAANPWTSLAVDDSREDFDFVVVTDRTGEHRDGVFENAMPKVNLLRPAFVMSVGDMIEGYSEDREQAVDQDFPGLATLGGCGVPDQGQGHASQGHEDGRPVAGDPQGEQNGGHVGDTTGDPELDREIPGEHRDHQDGRGHGDPPRTYKGPRSGARGRRSTPAHPDGLPSSLFSL